MDQKWLLLHFICHDFLPKVDGTQLREGVAPRGAPQGSREAGLVDLGDHAGQIAQPAELGDSRHVLLNTFMNDIY